MTLLLFIMILFMEFSRVACFFFEWGGMGETFVQTCTFDLHARFETRFCRTGSFITHANHQPKQARCGLYRHLRPIADNTATRVNVMNMKENILFLMYVIRGNFDHVGETSSSVSGKLRPHIKRLTHVTGKEKAEKDVQTSRKFSVFTKTECDLFQHKRVTPQQCKPDRHMLYFRKPNSGPTKLTVL